MAKNYSKNFIGNLHSLTGSKPYFWVLSAEELRGSADMIKAEIFYTFNRIDKATQRNRVVTYIRVMYMLYGLSIENLLKGLIIKENPGLFKDGILDKSLTNHELSDLAKKAKFKTSQEEFSMLRVLTKYVKWGKYPIPRKVADYFTPSDKIPQNNTIDDYLDRLGKSINLKNDEMINANLQYQKELINSLKRSEI